MITVTHNATSLNPELVLGYNWDVQLNNLSHDIIGSATPAFTFRPASPRSGTLSYLCLTESDAQQLAAMHSDAGTFTLSDDAVPYAAMVYVPMGVMNVSLDPQTRTRWVVSIGFKELI